MDDAEHDGGARVTSWWCKHAWLPSGEVAARALIETAGGRITRVEVDVDPLPHSNRLHGLVIPGLANVHSHAFHRALRGHGQNARGDFWVWRERMYEVAQRLDPDSYLALATAVYAEMALAGITCVGEFHYLHHGVGGARYGDPNAMGAALIQAAHDTGVRLTLLDTCYLRGGFDTSINEPQRRFSDGDVAGWAQRLEHLRDGDGVRIGAAIHSVRALDPDEMSVVVKVADDRKLPLHMHVSEQTAENEQCLAKYGRTPTAVLHDAGALRPGSVAVHATHLTDHDASLLASSGTGVCLCPTTERDLADGIGPAAALAASGVSLSLGSDSHAVIDLFEEARSVELDERLASQSRGHFTASQLLDAATRNGHQALGWPDAGAIAPGMRADLVAVDVGSPRTAGCGSTAEAVVFAASAVDVTDVVVGDRYVVRDRQHVSLPDVGCVLTDEITRLLR